MAACSSLRTGGGVGVHVSEVFPRTKHGFSGFSPFPQKINSKSKLLTALNLDLKEVSMDSTDYSNKARTSIYPYPTKSTSMVGLSKGMRWWEKTSTQNMFDICSAQHLVDSLMNAGDRLVVVHFYSPACGGCKSLHPKICQIAESNPEVVFLKVNQEELRAMCHSLNVHVLPFFRFYRGSHGKLCSFSCTIATISKFKKALAKHGNERCSLEAPKGLDEKELLALASAGELQKDITVHDLLKPSLSSSYFFGETEEQRKVLL